MPVWCFQKNTITTYMRTWQSNWLESEEKFDFTGELPESKQTRKRGKGDRNNGVKKQ